MKQTEKQQKKEAKMKAQHQLVIRRSPRMIDIRKFYKESSSSEEREKVLFRLNLVFVIILVAHCLLQLLLGLVQFH